VPSAFIATAPGGKLPPCPPRPLPPRRFAIQPPRPRGSGWGRRYVGRCDRRVHQAFPLSVGHSKQTKGGVNAGIRRDSLATDLFDKNDFARRSHGSEQSWKLPGGQPMGRTNLLGIIREGNLHSIQGDRHALGTQVLLDVKLRTASRQFDGEAAQRIQTEDRRPQAHPGWWRMFRVDRGRRADLLEAEDRQVPR
jgi:hypothetical protein